MRIWPREKTIRVKGDKTEAKPTKTDVSNPLLVVFLPPFALLRLHGDCVDASEIIKIASTQPKLRDQAKSKYRPATKQKRNDLPLSYFSLTLISPNSSSCERAMMSFVQSTARRPVA